MWVGRARRGAQDAGSERDGNRRRQGMEPSMRAIELREDRDDVLCAPISLLRAQ
jgi:hypothetical protein